MKDITLTINGRKNLKIIFDNGNPDRFLDDVSLFGLNEKQTKEALEKPFIVNYGFNVSIEYQNMSYSFTIPKGYTWNGANIPVFAWWLIGEKTDPRFRLASCIHDYMCENHYVVGYNRYLSTLVFETLCLYFGKFNDLKRWLMFHSVDNFQKFCGWN